MKCQPNPIRLLLYTEWLMLASCGSLAVVEALEERHLPVQHVLILTLLGVMGLRLPSGESLLKSLYTALEIGLVFYGTLLGYLHILPTLYLIVVIRSCFIFDLRGRWAIAALSFILFSIHQVQYIKNIIPQVALEARHLFWMHQLSELLMFVLALIFVIQFVNTLIAERQTRQQLASAHEQLQEYAFQVEELAAVQERNRIAREIHDSLGHALTALNIQLQTAGKLWQVDLTKARSFLTQAQRLGEIAIKEVRQSVNALRADSTPDEPLEMAIASLVEDFRQATGVSVQTEIYLNAILPSQIVKTIYRIVQEALTNICKYADATEVQIQLQTSAQKVFLLIEDNGNGFEVSSPRKGFGLQGMQERVAALQGSFYLESESEEGCRIIVYIPLAEVG
ncbi:MAG: sensor histidine kinase [Hydrococcus sp. Prado102]|jgi:signal transduction histidine kinase|nr:sensor histidine kinase [Hydrococcus sp. Prado102]